ncbi:hypothetical protein [Fusibacter ferrireducens]|uniref:Uncharacterized protein n=1 Tax=Fusibacter ferrireducens TaxID=2785058 RepID=A0ABR9ZPZ8_9FIRM|nr:hypothetical protein [Fusibacter ferrireducens]MBF4692543.1 hypothetical protein [Fusibacter ferrireducens]
MSVKAFIIEIDENEEAKEAHIKEKHAKELCLKEEEQKAIPEAEKSTPEAQETTGNLKFIVPGCATGNACNKCGNCH